MDLEHQPGGEGSPAPIISDEDFFARPSSPIAFSEVDAADAIDLIGGEDEEKSHQISGAENATSIGFEGEFRREVPIEREIVEIEDWESSLLRSDMRLSHPQEDQIKPTSSNLNGLKRKEHPDHSVSSTGPAKRLPLEWCCVLCKVTTTSEKASNAHLLGRKHKTKVALMINSSGNSISVLGKSSSTVPVSRTSNVWTCALCQLTVTSERVLNAHLGGRKHKAKEASMINSSGNSNSMTWKAESTDNLVKTGNATSKVWICALCQLTLTSEQVLNNHLLGRKHKAKEASIINSAGSSTSILGEAKSADNLTNTINMNPTEDLMHRPLADEPENCTDLEVAAGEISPDKGESVGLKKEALDSKRQNFKCWCNMCGVGTDTAVLMKAHMVGEGHMARMLADGGGVIALCTKP